MPILDKACEVDVCRTNRIFYAPTLITSTTKIHPLSIGTHKRRKMYLFREISTVRCEPSFRSGVSFLECVFRVGMRCSVDGLGSPIQLGEGEVFQSAINKLGY